MAELALITAKSLKACKVLEGHTLRIIDELKKPGALGPQKQPSKRPSDASSLMGGGDMPRWLNFNTSLFCTAAGELSGKFRTHLKYEISHNKIFPS